MHRCMPDAIIALMEVMHVRPWSSPGYARDEDCPHEEGAGHAPDTGYSFASPRTGAEVRVMRRVGESADQAITRVRAAHGA